MPHTTLGSYRQLDLSGSALEIIMLENDACYHCLSSPAALHAEKMLETAGQKTVKHACTSQLL